MKSLSHRGFSITELVMVIVIVSVIATYLAMSVGDTPDSVRWEQTRTKLIAIRNSILGDDATNAEGKRTHFGYFGDMGKIPGTLADLTTIGTQPLWAYDATVGYGYGWRGPYLSEGVTGSIALNKDEWGQAFVYNTSEPTPSISSYARDKLSGGTGYAKDVVVEFPQILRLGTVKGSVLDKDTTISGSTIQIDFPTAGVLTTSTTTSTAEGAFSFANIPFGIRTLTVTTPPRLGPKQITVDKNNFYVSAGIINYASTSESVSYVASSANLLGGSAKGYSTNTVVVSLKSTYRKDQMLKTLTGNWSSPGRLLSYTLNGITETPASPSPSGTTITPTTSQVVPALNDVNNLVLNFDGNMRNIPITLVFAWRNSGDVDKVTFTASPAWGVGGTLDTSFGTLGRRVWDFNAVTDLLYAINVTTDGNIVGCGSLYTHQTKPAVMRMTPDGALDTTFFTSGQLIVSNFKGYGTGLSGAFESVQVQTDGKIVVAGNVNRSGGLNNLGMVRFHTNGVLDTTFNSSGFVGIFLSTSVQAGVNIGLQIQSDGKYVSAFGNGIGSGNRWGEAVVRLTTDGVLDTSFNSSGSFTRTGTGNNFATWGVSIQRDGRYVTHGIEDGVNEVDFAMLRLNTNGVLDTTFNSTGVVTLSISGNDYGYADLVIQTDGRIVAPINSTSKLTATRFNTNGTLDTTFSSTGIATISAAAAAGSHRLMMQAADGRIVFGGNRSNGVNNDFSTVRLLTNGMVDTSFSSTGTSMTSMSSGNDAIFAIAIQSDGRILAAGVANGDVAIARFWP